MELKLKDTVTAEIMECQRHIKGRNGMVMAQPGDTLILANVASVTPLVVPAEAMPSYFEMEEGNVDPEAAKIVEGLKKCIAAATEHHGAILSAFRTVEEAIVDAKEHHANGDVNLLGEIGLIVGDIGVGVNEHLEGIGAALKSSDAAPEIQDIASSAGMIASCVNMAYQSIETLKAAMNTPSEAKTAGAAGAAGDEKGDSGSKAGGKKDKPSQGNSKKK